MQCDGNVDMIEAVMMGFSDVFGSVFGAHWSRFLLGCAVNRKNQDRRQMTSSLVLASRISERDEK